MKSFLQEHTLRPSLVFRGASVCSLVALLVACGSTSSSDGSGGHDSAGHGAGGSSGNGSGGSAAGSSDGGLGSGGRGASGGTAGGGGNAGAAGGTGPASEGGVSVGPVVNHGCYLVADANGWVDGQSNVAQVQGAVYTYASQDSTITPLTDATHPFSNAGDGRLCVHGSAAQVVGADYTTYFGAAMGIDLCHAGPTDPTPDAKFSLGTCPGGTKLTGLRFQVSGQTIPTELRVTFHEVGRDASTYVLASQGANVVSFSAGKVLYDPTAPAVDVTKIDSVHFSIPTVTTSTTPFDFCVENVELLTTGGACDDGAKSNDGGTPPGDGGGGASGLSGILPSNVVTSDASSAYQSWKASYLQSCSGQGNYVQNPQDGNSAYSEGIGYGMLLSVANADRTTFDGLFTFYGAHVDGNGLMNWKIAACGGATGNGSATDADLDVAMALVQASCRWAGSYAQQAGDLIGKIKSREIALQNGVEVVRPGDAFTDVTCVNPSYLAPGYFRAFGRVTSDATFWNKVADDSYALLDKLANAATGLDPNWGHTDGSAPHGECARTDATLFGYDAARTPWRIATDYRWWGTATAKTYLGKVVGWAKGQGIDSLGDRYNLNGSQVSGFHTPVTVGAFAAATVASDQATSDAFYQGLKGVTVNEYYPTSLKALYLTFGAGLFDRCVKP